MCMFIYKHIKQSTDKDCGIACLYMLFQYHKIKISYYRLRQEIFINDSGIALQDIISFLNKFNIKTKVLKIDNILKLGNVKYSAKEFPCIGVEKNSSVNHYILIYSVNRGIVKYSDPLSNEIKKENIIYFMGKLKYIIITDFSQCIKLREKYKKDKFYDSIINLFKDQLIHIIKIIILSVIISIFSLILSTQLGQYIDLVISTKSIANLYFLTFIYIVLLIIYSIFNNFRNLETIEMVKKIEGKINIVLIKNIFQQQYNDFVDFGAGDLSVRISDLTSIILVVTNFLMNLITDIILVLISLFFLMKLNINLVVYLLFFLIINFIIARFTYSKIYNKNYETIEKYSEYYGQIIESMNNFKNIKIIHSEKYFINRLQKSLETYTLYSKNSDVYTMFVTAIQMFMIVLTSIIMIAIGSSYVINSVLTIGELSIIVSISALLQNVVSRFV